MLTQGVRHTWARTSLVACHVVVSTCRCKRLSGALAATLTTSGLHLPRTGVGAITIGDVETLQVNCPSQPTQRIVEIQQIDRMGEKQCDLTAFRLRFGIHPSLKLQGFQPSGTDSLRSTTSTFPKRSRDSLINRLFHLRLCRFGLAAAMPVIVLHFKRKPALVLTPGCRVLLTLIEL